LAASSTITSSCRFTSSSLAEQQPFSCKSSTAYV
jgi:hypothetical protein